MTLAPGSFLPQEVAELRLRLEETEQTLSAIRSGEVDSLVVEGPDGPRVFTLEAAQNSYRVLVEAMSEGAATLAEDGTVLYCNRRFAQMVGAPLHLVMGASIHDCVPASRRWALDGLLRRAAKGEAKGELTLRGRDGHELPAYLSVSSLHDGGRRVLCLVATDLSEQRRAAEAVASAKLAHSVLQAVQESETRLRLALHAANGGAWQLDLESGEAWWSPELYELWGVEPGTPMRMDNTMPLVHELDRERVRREVESSIAGRKDYACEYRIRHAARGERWMLSRAVLAYEEAGTPVRLFGLCLDITDRKRAEERALRQNAIQAGITRMFREALSCPTEEDLGHVCLAACREVTQSGFGFIGTVNEESGLLDGLALSDPGSQFARLRGALDPGEPLHFALRGLLGRVVGDGKGFFTNDPASHPDHAGTPPGHPALASFLGVPLVHEGKTIAMIGLGNRDGGYGAEDLAAAELLAGAAVHAFLSRRSEAALRESEARLRSFFETPAVGAAELGPDGRFREVNDTVCQLTGYAREELLGMSPSDLTHAEDRAREEPQLAAYLCGKHPTYQSEKRYLRKDGTVVWVHVAAGLVRDASGKVLHSAGIIKDITARKVAEEALKEADRRKDEFLGLLSHELRNPLAPIVNALYILDHADLAGEQARRARQVIARQVSHMSGLVDDLLEVTRIARGKIQLHRGRVDLGEIVRRAVEDHGSVFAARDIDVALRADARSLCVDGDAGRITQIIGNLLQNAAKFTNARGHVRIAVERHGSSASVRVSDDGVGIDAETLPHVFEPFRQADRSLHRSQGGLGLGLALVKGLVELHGGSADARSDGVGRGSEFTIWLPLAAEIPLAVAPPHRAGMPLARRRVLVVEDNVDCAMTLKEVLELNGQEVMVAHDGRQGVERARSLSPEVVFCDIGLPGIDGYDVARQLRADLGTSPVLVALTGYARPEDQRRAAEAGFDHHLGKPLDVSELLALLARLPGRPR